jgi:hypothetical protein
VTAAIAAGPSGALPTRLLCALGCGLAVKAGALRGAFCGSSRGANNRVLAYRMLIGLSNDADSIGNMRQIHMEHVTVGYVPVDSELVSRTANH